jgi:hypothetical protein
MTMIELDLPPSVRATSVSPKVSDKYVRVDSQEIIKLMQEEGFVLADVRVGRNASEYGKHMLDFRHADAPLVLDNSIPRILFTNSHDGSTSARFAAGIFRLICSNGLVIGSTFANERVRHAGEQAHELVERMRKLAKDTTPMIDQIEGWRKVIMSASRQQDFAREAAALRFDDPDRFDRNAILAPRRDEDVGDSLWTVFNRIQENTVQGGITGQSANGRSIRSRPITSLTRDFEYNQALWKLAEKFAN